MAFFHKLLIVECLFVQNPQRCEVCDKVFSYPAQLHNHMKTHDATNVKKVRICATKETIQSSTRKDFVLIVVNNQFNGNGYE